MAEAKKQIEVSLETHKRLTERVFSTYQGSDKKPTYDDIVRALLDEVEGTA